MPDINGLELINFVRSNARYSHVPIIIVSTERSEEDKKEDGPRSNCLCFKAV